MLGIISALFDERCTNGYVVDVVDVVGVLNHSLISQLANLIESD